MMKARRNFKEEQARKVSKEEQKNLDKMNKLAEAETKVWVAQMEEFGAWLKEETEKPKPFGFLVDMHKKLVLNNEILSDNMMNALRRCKDRDKPKTEPSEVRMITLKIKPFLMKSLDIDSRVITGQVKGESAKAWLIEGHADMIHNASFCVRCMKELTEPASQITGMGKTCATKAGLPYDPTNVLQASKKERDKIRKSYVKKLHNQKFERWIPKSQSEVIND